MRNRQEVIHLACRVCVFADDVAKVLKDRTFQGFYLDAGTVVFHRRNLMLERLFLERRAHHVQLSAERRGGLWTNARSWNPQKQERRPNFTAILTGTESQLSIFMIY